jgi:hypothetical protein
MVFYMFTELFRFICIAFARFLSTLRVCCILILVHDGLSSASASFGCTSIFVALTIATMMRSRFPALIRRFATAAYKHKPLFQEAKTVEVPYKRLDALSEGVKVVNVGYVEFLQASFANLLDTSDVRSCRRAPFFVSWLQYYWALFDVM